MQGNGIFAKTSAFSACPTYFQRVFLSAKTFRRFQRKTAVRIDSERKKPKKPRVTETSAAFYRPISVFCSDLRPARFDLLPPRKLSPISPFSVGFYEPSQAPCPKVGAESSLSAFYAVLRVFTLPLKKIFLIPLSSFDLSCFRRRTESFPFTRSISRFEDALRDLLSHTRRPVDTQRRARRFKPRNLPYNAFLRPARFPLCKKSSRPILPLFRRRKALSRIAEP